MKYLLFSFSLLVLFFAGCKEETPVQTNTTSGSTLAKWDVPDDVRAMLLQVRAATAKYHNINLALADGYEDIDVIVPHMGHHFLKSAYLDSVFDATHPELLVYSLMPNGRYELVAVEYAVPVPSVTSAPEGFPGDYDTWVINQTFNLWTLHAWIWKDNPDGVFAAMNPNVP